ncbi:hypothetical protein [Palleronia sp. LCG004]|uniref:hypothetical protein n=1 Tax=Palleronia sp. LCG004 TaxID=3079304 RepID=UPI002942D85B|nr:hypothetical protein [Palleronia sp. LCG004]WOI55121.1 hypothetical protein RVY76_08610 [Palleronia sp. LCG004]
MTDRRQIDGTVRVEQESVLAATAYRMAQDIWNSSREKSPRIDDHEFFDLVKKCQRSLRGL